MTPWPTQTFHFSGPEPAKLWHVLLIAAVSLTLNFAGNGQTRLWDRDEPRYAQAAREMIQTGNFIAPTFNSEPRYQKPILIYWLMAASYGVFGDNEFGARFCSSFAGIVTCLLTYRLGRNMFARSVGLAAALMLAVSPLVLVEHKLATTDAVLVALLMGIMTCIWELYSGGSSRRKALLMWLLLGLAVLEKGPIGPGLLIAAMLAWLALSGQWRFLGKLNWLSGSLVVAAVVLPWCIAVYVVTDGAFYRKAIGDEAMGHALSTMESHRGFPGYYLAVTLAGLFPWSMGLWLALTGARQWWRGGGPETFLLGWMLGPLIVLELMFTKLPHYFLFALPACVLFLARGFVAFHATRNYLWQTRLCPVALGIVTLVAICLAVLLLAGPISLKARVLEAPAISAAAVLALGTLLALVFFRRTRDVAGWVSLVTAWGVFEVVAAGWLVPSAEQYRYTTTAAHELLAQKDEQTPLVLHQFREPTLVFYLEKPVPVCFTPDSLCAFVKAKGAAVTVLQEPELDELRHRRDITVEVCKSLPDPLFDARNHFPVWLARLVNAPSLVIAKLR